MKPYYDDGNGIVIYNADCRDVLKSLDDSSVDLIVTDPPYFKVKSDWWDRQWEKPEAFLSWMGALCDEWRRVLKPNGSLYVFASPQMAWGVEGEIRKRFNVLNRIHWRKVSSEALGKGGPWERGCKEGFRGYFPQTEEIIFAEQFNSDNHALGETDYTSKCDELRGFVFEPLRAYLAGEWERAGLTAKDANIATSSQMAGHYLTRVQWALPTEEKYEQLRTYARKHGQPSGDYLRREYDYLRREYEDLRREYEDLRREYEDLRRPFFASDKRPYTDVWDFATVSDYPGKHPCEKPLKMIEHIIETSSREGALVLDCFAGSGVVGEACRNFERRAILCEIDATWSKHIEGMLRQGVLF